MGAIWFVIGVISTLLVEMIACIIYAVIEVKKRGRK